LTPSQPASAAAAGATCVNRGKSVTAAGAIRSTPPAAPAAAGAACLPPLPTPPSSPYLNQAGTTRPATLYSATNFPVSQRLQLLLLLLPTQPATQLLLLLTAAQVCCCCCCCCCQAGTTRPATPYFATNFDSQSASVCSCASVAPVKSSVQSSGVTCGGHTMTDCVTSGMSVPQTLW
jgi:hypothetical protein